MWNENGTQNMFQISTMAEDDIKDDCGLLTRIKYLTDILLIFIFVLYLFSYIATYSFKYSQFKTRIHLEIHIDEWGGPAELSLHGVCGPPPSPQCMKHSE